ncbi:MAG: UDP-glucuronate decarboxylase [Dehalococcoidia bacterium]
MRRRAVLTGGAGFLGSHLAERLLDAGLDVLCIDNLLTGSPDNVAGLQNREGFSWLRADITERVMVPGPVDFVLHLASPASPIDYAEFPIKTMKVGSIGTLNTLGLAREKNARYLLASTSESYGDPLVHPQREDYWGNVNPVGPRACYDEAKRFAEALTTSYRTQHGLDTVIIRIFNTYGPRMRPNDGRAIPTFVRQALTGEPITVAGDGSQTRSVCYVDDLIDGILRAMFADIAGPVNIGNPHELTVLELAELVRDLAGSDSPIEFVPRPQDDPSVRRPDITVARTQLDWEPTVRVADGLLRTIDWFRRELSDQPAARQPDGGDEDGMRAYQRRRIAVVGTGYVGAVTATCLAWLGHEVCGLDTDQVQAGQLNQGQAPFFEPGLPELLTSALASRRLRFTHRPEEALRDADVVFLCVGTPPTKDGTPDLTCIESAVRSLGPFLHDDMVIVNKSTVPVGCGNWTRTILEDALPRTSQPAFHVVSNPEFLREGSAIEDFLAPDRIVLGGSEDGVRRVASVYRPVLDQSYPGGHRDRKPGLITTPLASAEMIKYASNAFLATKISFANEIANICELVGADAREVLPAIGADRRIGRQFLTAGIGWGGSCFGKDVAALMATGREYGYAADLLRISVEVNQLQRAGAVRKLQHELRVLKGRRIALLGLAFKPNTDDLRDAPALDVARRLLEAGAVVSAYDPVVKRLPDQLSAVRLASDVYDAADRADAVVLTTEWPEFRDIDATLLRRTMRGELLLDCRNFLSEAFLGESGLRLEGFGWSRAAQSSTSGH